MSVTTSDGINLEFVEPQNGDFSLRIRGSEGGIIMASVDLTLSDLMNLEVHLGEVIEAREGEPRLEQLQIDSREDLKALLKEAVTEVIETHPMFHKPPPPIEYFGPPAPPFPGYIYPPKGPDAGV